MTNHLNQDPMRILIDLLKLLSKADINSNTLIDFIERNSIHPDTYLPGIHGQSEMPLIYYCCQNTNLEDFFSYLLKKQVNLMSPMICENSNENIELLYYSQINYIPTLIEYGCRLNPELIPMSCEKLLIKGNINKLIILYKHGAITKDQLINVTQRPGLIFRILDHLYERIYILCQKINDQTKLKELIKDIMNNYLNVFKLFFKNTVNINQIENDETFVQRVLNTYFIDLIKLVIQYQADFSRAEFLHYSNFDLSNRQVMHLFYNDENYQNIYNLIRDKILPDKINVKKPNHKKKII